MYNVSSDYINIMRSTTRTDKLIGTILFPGDDDPTPLTSSNIVENSVSITKQCVDGDELNLGSAIIGELEISFYTNRSRYDYFGAEISLTYQVLISGSTWESVPLGTYTVAEADRTGTYVKVVAYDAMQNFDAAIGSTVLAGTPYKIIKDCCEDCGVTFGTHLSDISSWPNSSASLNFSADSGCTTYRGIVKCACQILGCFAIVNRENKLVLRRFESTSVATLTKSHRYSTTIADFECTYAGLEVTSTKGTFSAYSEEETGGLIMVYDDAPAWDYGVEETLQGYTDDLFEYVEALTYTPVEIDMPGDPAFECGDRLQITVDASDSVYTWIMCLTWKYHGTMELTSKGDNPYLNSTSAIIQNRILTKDVESSKLTLYSLTNTDEVSVSAGGRAKLGDCYIASAEATSCVFVGAIQVDVTVADTTTYQTLSVETNASIYDETNTLVPITGSVQVPIITKGYVDIQVDFILGTDTTTPTYSFTEHLCAGKHEIPLFYNLASLQANTTNHWWVYISVTGGSIVIDDNDFKGVIFGQGMVGGDDIWDGTIEALDEFTAINVGDVITVNFTDSVTATTQTPTTANATETFQAINIGDILNINFTDSAEVTTEEEEEETE